MGAHIHSVASYIHRQLNILGLDGMNYLAARLFVYTDVLFTVRI
jgi:hypothetical protein